VTWTVLRSGHSQGYVGVEDFRFLTSGADMSRLIASIKVVTVVAFMVTLFATYYLREEVLLLNELRFSAEDLRAERQLQRAKETYPQRLESHQIALKNYDLQLQHYDEMLKLYKTDYEAYAKRLEDKYQPPQVPYPPQKPEPPQLQDELLEINAKFRSQQHHYFASATALNWVVCASALILCGGLLLLIMFEAGPQRFAYLVVLGLSFVFMIGPSFHSIMSAVVGFLHPPRGY